RANTPPLREQNPTTHVNVDAVTNIDHIVPQGGSREVPEERVLAQHVIAVDPGRVRAGAHSQTTVDGGALTAVRLANPKVDPRRILLDNLDGLISTAAIEDKVLEILVALQEDGPDGFLEELPLIERWGHDRDSRPRSRAQFPFRESRAFFGPRPSGLVPRRLREFS